MGKVVKFTGSRVLGEELRRLRAGRTLDDIVALGKAKLVPYGFKSVAPATLSEIENGRTLPSIESVFALSILYQVPTSRFLHLLLEENLVEGVTAPEDPEELHAAYTAAVRGQRPTEALALATHALRQAPPGWETIRWRLNRAVAIERLGMRWDAIAELQDQLDQAELPSNQRFLVHQELGRMHASAGQFSLAEMHLQRAMAIAPSDLTGDRRAGLLHAKVRLTVSRKAWGLVVPDSEIDEAELALEEALRLSSTQSASEQLALLSLQASLAWFRGDVRAARSLFSTVLTRARTLCLPTREFDALSGLASIELRRSADRARRLLVDAAELAVSANHVDKAFEAYYDLYKLAESPAQQAHYLRKCQRLYPLVQSSHPSVRAFETRAARERQ